MGACLNLTYKPINAIHQDVKSKFLLLISPPYSEVYKRVNTGTFGVCQPPLGLAYIASYIQSRGHAVKLFDAGVSIDPAGEIEKLIRDLKPDFVGITATTPQILNAWSIALQVKNINPAIKTIIGGFHVSALPQESMDVPSIDIVACGEGELTVAEILEGRNQADIRGIWYRQDGSIRQNPPRPLIEDLDTLPFPLWEQLPVQSYYYYPEKTVGVISGRGCPYDCSFCASAVIHKRRYRMRSPGNFVDEVEMLYRKYGMHYLFFVDETFTINLQRTEEICRLIIDRKIPIRWTCDTRADRLTKDILTVMKRAGCRSVRMGVESADEAVLKATGKGTTPQQVQQAIGWARKLGLSTTTYYLLGLPYETPQSIEKTARFSRKIGSDLSHFTMLVPLPGTRIWDIAQEGKLLRCSARSWSEYTRFDSAIVESDTLSREQLRTYHRKLVRRAYMNPRYIIRRLFAVRSMKDISSLLSGARALVNMVLPDAKSMTENRKTTGE